jgi:hypothetical protein
VTLFDVLGGTSRQPSWVSVVVLIGELLGPAPTSPERPYEKAWTAFDFATSTSHCVSRWAIFSTMGFIRP